MTICETRVLFYNVVSPSCPRHEVLNRAHRFNQMFDQRIYNQTARSVSRIDTTFVPFAYPIECTATSRARHVGWETLRYRINLC